MDDEELLYREMNPEDPWYMGDDYEDEGEGDFDEEVNSRRNAFLLFWDPSNSSFTLEDYANTRQQYGRRFSMNWSIDLPDDAQVGDRYYMVRVGEGRTGIVWHGTFSSEPYEDEHWNGSDSTCWYVDINVEDAVKPYARPLVTLDEMKQENADVDWENMLCGQTITPELADRFDEIARMNRFKESHSYNGYASKEAYEAEERRQLRNDIGYCLYIVLIFIFGIAVFAWLLT